jgi:hypothetical protein
MNATEKSFMFNDTHITNPTLSEDGRDSVSPSHYGFIVESTGGGSSAWVKYFTNGVIVLTNDDGVSHELGDNFMMGFYDGSEDDGTWGNTLAIIEEKEITQ